MKITICGSVTFMKEMQLLAKKLKSLGFEKVFLPIASTPGHQWREDMTTEELAKRKRSLNLIRRHYHKILMSDCILVANFEKREVPGYVGGNTFLEIGFAFVLGKPVFMLYPVPDMPYTAEIDGMEPIVINNELKNIRKHYQDQ